MAPGGKRVLRLAARGHAGRNPGPVGQAGRRCGDRTGTRALQLVTDVRHGEGPVWHRVGGRCGGTRPRRLTRNNKKSPADPTPGCLFVADAGRSTPRYSTHSRTLPTLQLQIVRVARAISGSTLRQIVLLLFHIATDRRTFF